jgi:hypothetical protein
VSGTGNGLLCESGFANVVGIGGEDGGELGLLCTNCLKERGGVGMDASGDAGVELKL